MRYFAIFFIIIACISGCGYRMGSLGPPAVRSVAVPIFENKTLFRDFEFQLTQAVVDEILTKTSMYVTDPESADSILRGTIVDIKIRSIIKNEDREAVNQDIVITVVIDWVDSRSNQPIIPTRRLTRRVEVDLDQGENFAVETAEGFDDLARFIVFQLESIHLLDG